ncbi:4a-hydroxytetrahydrobiopterin dehydratase [Patescibacteria group bacterium]|nr:MAG: 4a-hydroxytetrahydrobiopterin dehydratase [Patescibacteria group bacterium]
MEPLARKKCVPCEGSTPPLNHSKNLEYLKQINQWELEEDRAIEKTYLFKDFAAAMKFLNEVARIAEEESHHPDFCLRGWNKVTIRLSTHAVGGLSENDFILAAKIDEILPKT